MPFNGSEYVLSCTVSVDSSVDTAISISSQWVDSTGMSVSAPNVSSNTEELGSLQQRTNLTFRPLRSEDDGSYTCNAAVTPEQMTDFIVEATATETYSVTVKSKLWSLLKKWMCLELMSPSPPCSSATAWGGADCQLWCWNRRR